MNKVLSKGMINYILLQMLIITFVCTMMFIELFIKEDLIYLSYGIQTSTLVVFILYESILHYTISRIKNREKLNKTQENEETNEEPKKAYNEKYLWFELLLLLDLLLVIGILTTLLNNENLFIIFLIGIGLYYIISLVARPFFGVKHNKDK